MKQKRHKGFALIVALTLMGFVLLLALSLMSLLRVEVTATESGEAKIAAQNNAWFALNEAIAELQLTLGPDQRVSATADILPGTNANKKHTAGVWAGGTSTAKGDKATTPAVNIYGRNYNPGDFIRWLVSDAITTTGVPNEGYNTAAQASGNEAVTLVGEGSVLNNDADKIKAFRTPMTRDDATIGYYAWWVGDEGVKARINLPATDFDQISDDNEKKLAAIRARTQSEWSNIAGIADFSGVDLRKDQAGTRIGDPWQLQMFSNIQDIDKPHFHNLTYSSRGVIADAYHGGLKGDLSLAFEMNDNAFDASEFGAATGDFTEDVKLNVYGFGISDFRTTPLFVEDNAAGPSWHLLRDYYRLYRWMQNPMSNPKLAGQQALPDKLMMEDAGRAPAGLTGSRDLQHPHGVWAGTYLRGLNRNAATVNGRRMFLLNQGTNGDLLHTNSDAPIMIRAAYTPYPNKVIMQTATFGVPDPEAPGNLFPHILQRGGIVFHNPYNVTVHMPETWFQLTFPSSVEANGVVEKLDPAGQNAGLVGAAGHESEDFAPGQLIISPGRQRKLNSSGVLLQNADKSDWRIEGEMLDWDEALHYGHDRAANAGGTQRTVKIFTESIPEPVEIKGLPMDSKLDVYIRIFSRGSDRNRTPRSLGGMTAPDSGNNGVVERDLSLTYFLDTGDADIDATSWWNDANTSVGLNSSYSESNPLPLQGLEWSLLPASSGSSSYPTFAFTNPIAPVQTGMNLLPKFGTGTDAIAPAYPVKVLGHSESQDFYIDDKYGWGADAGAGLMGSDRVVLIDLPTAPPLSLGQLQNANISPIGFMPYFAIGNSFASPYIAGNRTTTTFRNWENQNRLFYDLSYLSNKALWDSFFFSSYSLPYDAGADKFDGDVATSFEKAFVTDKTGLPNKRMSLYLAPGEDTTSVKGKLFNGNAPSNDGYKRSAENLLINGAFNINSTSEEAWAALLSAARGVAVYDSSGSSHSTPLTSTPVSRLSQPLKGAWSGSDSGDDDAWAGFRHLTDTQIRTLASNIVGELKLRAANTNGSKPFLSMADFVNRHLGSNTDYNTRGLLQAAIDRSNLNSAFESSSSMSVTPGKLSSFPNSNAVAGGRSAGAMAPGYILQGDLLTLIGEAVSVRSDTFKIRAYGSVVDPNDPNKITAQAWCEAVVQRVPAPLQPQTGTSPDNVDYWGPRRNELADSTSDYEDFRKFGRRFEIVEFRWLSPDEV